MTDIAGPLRNADAPPSRMMMSPSRRGDPGGRSAASLVLA